METYVKTTDPAHFQIGMTHPLVVALDPGETTGAALRDSEGNWTIAHFTTLLEVYTYLCDTNPPVIIYERFIIQPRQKIVPAPLKVIGVVELYQQQFDPRLVAQTPSQAKNFVSDTLLRRNNLWIRGMQHGRDAVRHLLYWLITERKDASWLEVLKPPAPQEETTS